jgi:hypothetical protein
MLLLRSRDLKAFPYSVSHFHQNDIGYNATNGMWYDYILLNSAMGLTTKSIRSAAQAKGLCRYGVCPC